MSMKAMDLQAIQECMVGYRRLIDLWPVTNEMEVDLKHERIGIINHIINITDNELRRLSEEYRNECD